jgi:YD repeat-containing protein
MAVRSYTYDLNDRLATTTYPDGEVVTTGYDNSGQPWNLSSPTEAYITDARYDLYGRSKLLQHGNGTVDKREYYTTADGFNLKLRKLKTLRTELGATKHLDLSFGNYNARGQLTQLNDLRNATGNLSIQGTYTYDFMGRLDGYAAAAPSATQDYDYDNLNRILLLGSRSFTYSATKPHQVNALNGQTVQHDDNGNRKQKHTDSYLYTRGEILSSQNNTPSSHRHNEEE